MSVHTFVFLEEGKLPTIAEWNVALGAASVDLVLDAVDDLVSFSGFLPAKLNGRAAGFEWFFGPVEDVFGDAPGDLGDRTLAADFVTHSDMTELAFRPFRGRRPRRAHGRPDLRWRSRRILLAPGACRHRE